MMLGCFKLTTAVAIALASFVACNTYLVSPVAGTERIFTSEELAQYNGTYNGRKVVYLAILGSVYDVTKGAYYFPGGGYEFFGGRDASRAFVSGNFSGDGLTDDLTGLKPSQYAGVYGWKKFYDDADNYYYRGKLLGRYYTAEGERTAELDKVDEMVKVAESQQKAKENDQKEFKTCNSKWQKNTGTEVYCKNGLLPRRLVRDGHELFGKERCTCATPQQWAKHKGEIMFLYENCEESSPSCKKPKKEDKK